MIDAILVMKMNMPGIALFVALLITTTVYAESGTCGSDAKYTLDENDA